VLPAPEKEILINPGVALPWSVKLLPAAIVLPELSIVTVLLPGEEVKTTVAELLIVRLLIVEAALTLMVADWFINTSWSSVGIPKDQLPAVFQLLFTAPVHVLGCDLATPKATRNIVVNKKGSIKEMPDFSLRLARIRVKRFFIIQLLRFLDNQYRVNSPACKK
jgi:hypothetical protein